MEHTISIIGTGYVGLTTAAILSSIGYKVYTIDIDEKKIDIIKTGKSYFHELGLDEFVENGLKSGNLIPTLSYEESIPNSDIVFSCVGTPDNSDGSSNLEYIFSAAESFSKYAKDGAVYVQKSTVPVGTGRKIIKFINEKKHDLEFSYVSNPEFLAEGSAVHDTLFIDRLVVGGDDKNSLEKIKNIFSKIEEQTVNKDFSNIADYATFYKTLSGKRTSVEFNSKVVETDLESAELIKVTANAFLALKISFANSIALLCDKTHADVNNVMNGVGLDDRIGKSFLYAGLGWGGGCFPKDVSGLISIAKIHDVEMPIMEAAVNVNNDMADYVISKIDPNLTEKIAVLGLSFKPGTSDVRRSPSIKLVNKLIEKGHKVKVYDPKSMDEAIKELDPQVELTENIDQCVTNTGVIILATEWKEFIDADWKRIKEISKAKIIIDARNRLDKENMKEIGFEYKGVGRD
ncbi:MAG: UDP-glucose/GDP-mannose dehydrogenase family protein [bacterium]